MAEFTDDNQPAQQRIQALNEIVSRAKLAAKLGEHYGGNRDVYEALGYKDNLTYFDFATQHSRQDIAKAVIDRPVNATWRGGVSLLESVEDDETPLEQAWDELYQGLRLDQKLPRLDRLAGLGRFGVLLLGLDDVQDSIQFREPVQSTGRRLLYVKPFGEGSASVDRYIDDPSDPRFGLPETYKLELAHPGIQTTQDVIAHHTRVVHVADGLMESEVFGTPRLQAVFNRLKDLEKVVGGSGEMFWRGARPGYQGKIDSEYGLTSSEEDNLQSQIDEFENNLRRIMINEGIDLQSLAPQVADPTNHVNVQLQMISAETGIPLRILVGSERGELASSQDRSNWLELIKGRREEYAEPAVLNPLAERLIEIGALPPPQEEEFGWRWTDLFAPSEQEKADVGKTRAEALKSYASVPLATEIIPPDQFQKHFLGLDEGQVEEIQSSADVQLAGENAEAEADEGNNEA